MEVDEKLLLRILKHLLRKKVDDSNPLPWNEFQSDFKNISARRLSEHVIICENRRFITTDLFHQQRLSGTTVRGNFLSLTLDGRQHVKSCCRDTALRFIKSLQPYGLIVFGAIIGYFGKPFLDGFFK